MLMATRRALSFLVAGWHLCAVHSFGQSPASTPLVDYDVIIVGGSIGGLSTAVALSSPSHSSPPPRIAVYERARRIEPIGALLSLFPNGMTALRSIDANVANEVMKVSIPLQKSKIRGSVDGTVMNSIQSNAPGDGSSGTFLCWYQLQQILTSALRPSFEDIVTLGTEFISYAVDDATGRVTVTCRDRNNGDATFERTCRVLVGADGVQSAVRRQMMADEGRTGALNSYDRVIFRALVDTAALNDDLVVPEVGVAAIYKSDEVGRIFKLWKASDGTLAVTATVKSDDDEVTIRGWSSEEAKAKMAKVYADFAPEIRDLVEQIPSSSIYANAVCDMNCLQNWSDGPVLVIGDAAHAMTPSLGQGANIGLEDAAELGCILRESLSSDSQECITDSIRRFGGIRQERVEEIHAASRMQALNKNKKDTTLGAFRERDPGFFERLYGWAPTLHSRTMIKPRSETK